MFNRCVINVLCVNCKTSYKCELLSPLPYTLGKSEVQFTDLAVLQFVVLAPVFQGGRLRFGLVKFKG